MRAKSAALPFEQVEIENHGYEATVTLWDGTYETETDADGNVEYVYDIYQTRHRWRVGLEEAVYTLFDEWYAAAKKAEDRKYAEAEIDVCKARLAETDYRIIKCYEYSLAGLDPPYNITELHAGRQALRNNIAAMEAALHGGNDI